MQNATTSPKPLFRKILSLLFLSFLLFAWKPGSFTFSDFLGELHLKLNQFTSGNPASKTYLACDKPLYEPGDVIWFSVSYRNGYSLAGQHGQVAVQLINPQGAIEAVQYLYSQADQGNLKGNFNLKPDQPGGLYKLKVLNNYTGANDNNLIFEREIQVQEVVLQRLKLTLDYDRKAYGPGSEVTARVKAFSNQNQPLQGSAFRIVVSLNGKKVQQNKAVIDKKGVGRIKFQLPDSLKSTDGNLNLIFDYEGIAESVSKTIPIVLNKVQLSFFPEGGELVNGLPSQLAFRALNEFNKPADVAGEVLDETNNVVATFSSFHDGMGEFNFTPQEGKTYKARLTSPAGIKTTYNLPEPMPTGYVLQVDRPEADKVKFNVRSALKTKVAVVGQVRGKIYYQETLDLVPGDNKAEFSTADFPIGVMQLTLFDQRTIERAERLVFINNHKQLQVKIKTDKDKYLPREKVRLTVSASDETGMPIPADLMVSVVDDQLLSYMNDKSSNILSWMLVESEIKGKVDEPKFYFDKEEPKAPVALDLLLKTAGWRRFTWETVKKINLPLYQYSGDKLLPRHSYEVIYMQSPNYYKEIAGQVAIQNEAILSSKPKIKLIQYGKLLQVINTNELGNFRFSNLQSGKYDLEIELEGQKSGLITGIEIQQSASPYLNVNLPQATEKPGDIAFTPKAPYVISYSKPDGKSSSLKGVIIDQQTRGPLAFATVVLKQKDKQKGHAQTDVNGFFTIANVKPGTYTLEAPYVGYTTKVIKGVKIKEAKNTSVAFEITSDKNELATVEVVSYREPLVSPEKVGETITQEEILKLPTREVRTMATTTAGVQSFDDSRSLNVKGARNSGTTYYVNGVKQLTAPALPSTKKPATPKPQITRALDDERQKFRDAGMAKKVVTEPHDYIRIREFPVPVYANAETPKERSDFRKTIFWQPNVRIGRSGVAVFEFYTGDDITSYNVLVEGVSFDGSPGRNEHKFYSQLPFNILAKLPNTTLENDRISVPLILKNNTATDVKGKLKLTHPAGWTFLGKENAEQVVKANSTTTFYLDYQVTGKTGASDFGASFEAQGLKDAFIQPVTVEQRGYPIHKSLAGSRKEQDFLVDISNMNPGTAQVSFSAYPSVVADLLKGVEGILQEPYGCFEQTSSSSYPNLMVLDYLKEQENPDKTAIAKAEALMDKGYKRLVTFETEEKGYEWFGGLPAHEGLTAYGLLQFTDMKRLGGHVDADMLNRTSNWMLNRRDGNGGFKLASSHGGSYGHAEPSIANAYILYSLAESGYKDLQKEMEQSCQATAASNDPYRLALMTNALYASGNRQRGQEFLNKLLKLQAENGSWTGTKHSVTYSTGQSLQIETTALAVMAMLKAEQKPMLQLQQAIKFLTSSRNGYGSFGSTQATILSLKALTAYARYNKFTKDDGNILFYVDRKKAGEQTYLADQTGEIRINDLNKYFEKPGNYNVKVQYDKTNYPLPYSVALSYYSNLPPNSPACKVKLETNLTDSETNVGNTVRYTAKIKNLQNDGLPMTMAIVGIPAGLSVQPAQLKELMEKKVIDFYEITGNRLVCYLRDMAPSEEVVVNLDLKAEFPGTYESPAGSAYLYYTNEHKNWVPGSKITIKP